MLNTLENVFSGSFFTSSSAFKEFDAIITILFEVQVFTGKTNGTTLSMYLIKTTAL